MEAQLQEMYKQIFAGRKNEPAWATHKNAAGHTHELIHCPIPFVGKNYAQQNLKILLYASAENLAGYTGYLDIDEVAISRHRNFFDWSVAEGKTYFPNVHIQPINDGALALVALYVYMQCQPIGQITPVEFLERISLANYCKYTIQAENTSGRFRNQDYANNSEYLRQSHDYLKADLEILKPDYIIMPKAIYWADKEFIDQVKGKAKIIPVYQMNARNINLRIKKYPKTPMEELSPVLRSWYEALHSNGITGKTKENFLSVFAYLDDVLQNQQV